MLCVHGSARSEKPEEEGVCTLFLFDLRNMKAKYGKMFPSDVLQNIHISRRCGFPVLSQGREKALHRAGGPSPGAIWELQAASTQKQRSEEIFHKQPTGLKSFQQRTNL